MTTYLMNYPSIDEVKIYLIDHNTITATVDKSDNLGIRVTQNKTNVFVIPWTSILKLEQIEEGK